MTGFRAAISLALVLLTSVAANADSISFDLTHPNPAVSGFPEGFVSVSVDLTSATSATISFSSLPSGGYDYLMVDGSAAAVNVNASGFIYSSFVCASMGSPFQSCSLASSGPGTADGFGSFNLTFTLFDSFAHATNHLSFVVTNTSGTWGSANDVLVENSKGHAAASHIAVCRTGSCTPTLGALATGYASASTLILPEPASIALFGGGILGMAMIFRRRISGHR